MKTKKNLSFIIGVIAIALLFAAYDNTKKIHPVIINHEITELNKGDMAPMFELKDLNGNKVALADFAGEKVYVKYWASWCSICLAGLDELNHLAAQDNDFNVISVVNPGFKGEQTTEDFTSWFQKIPTNQMTVLLDEDGVWAKKFRVIGYPSSFFIGSDGILVKSAPGHHSNEVIRNTFKEIR